MPGFFFLNIFSFFFFSFFLEYGDRVLDLALAGFYRKPGFLQDWSWLKKGP